ncbi:MAG TPA: hypothetical protein VIV65_06125, partial [Gemmatimonadaceae bacterium]
PEAEISRLQAQRGGAEIPEEQIRPNYLRKRLGRGNVTADFGTVADLTLNTGLTLQQSQIPNTGIFGAAAAGSGYRDANDGWSGVNRPGEYFSVRSSENVSHLISSVMGNWRPTTWLSSRGTLGIDYSNNFSDNLQRRGEGPISLGQQLGSRQNSNIGTTTYTADFGSSVNHPLTSRVTSKSSIGVQYVRRLQRTTTARGNTLPPGSESVTGAATLISSESNVESIVAGAYGEQVFGLNDRLFLTAALRADGSSTFGANFKTAFYPKAGLSWQLSSEPFFPKIPGVGTLRYRLAYGASGVQPSSIAALPQVTLLTTFVNGTTQSGALLNALGNPNLRPEKQAEIETGLDAELLSGRIRFEGTYYRRQSSDALIQRALPQSVGITSTGRLENLGAVRNEGVEGLLTARFIDRADLALDLTLNASANRNRLTKLQPGVGPPEDRFIQFRQGYPLFGQWDRPLLAFNDANKDGVIVESEVTVGDSIVFLGNTNPMKIVDATPSVTLLRGRVRVSSVIEYKGGWVQTNFTQLNKCSGGGGSCRAVNDPNAPLWDQARFAAFNSPVYGRTYAGYEQDGSFTRWREASVVVTLPQRFLKRLNAEGATVTLAARNLHLWTKYDGLDPEVTQNPTLAGNFGAQWDLGYDNPVSPQSRYWIARMNLIF